jgi:hypothetical protein
MTTPLADEATIAWVDGSTRKIPPVQPKFKRSAALRFAHLKAGYRNRRFGTSRRWF